MFKSMITKTLSKVGGPLGRWINRDNIVVLMYHGVTPDDCETTKGDWLQLRESDFFQQMEYLHKHYEVVPLNKGGKFPRSHAPARHTRPRVVITFDDGYANNYTTALPILQHFKFPATVFLVTETINTDRMYWFDKIQTIKGKTLTPKKLDALIESFKGVHPHKIDEVVESFLFQHESGNVMPTEEEREAYRTLSFEEIEEMAKTELITFGSHTHRHELLSLLNEKETKETLLTSHRGLIRYVPNAISWLCYPNGYYKKEYLHLVSTTGYKGAVTTQSGFWKYTTNINEIPRMPIGSDMNIDTFISRITGVSGYIKKFIKR